MRPFSLLPRVGYILLLDIFLLTGCATEDPAAPKAPAVTLPHLMSEADAASRAGQYDKSLLILKGAAASFPASKTPWLQMAQMKFDRANYGDAVGNALEVLQRDPEDTIANSILVVSGLRLSTKALADLTRQNNLSGSTRSEAQVLAKLLRTSLGEDMLVPPLNGGKKGTVVKTAPKTPVTSKASGRAAAPTQSSSADPFDGLK
jgi:hypothetical protein